MFPYTFDYAVGATPISGAFAEWVKAEANGTGEIRFNYETRGPWGLVSSLRGMAITHPDGRDQWGHVKGRVIFHGIRTLSGAKESGYQLEGRVSVAGEKHRAFTSSLLVRLPSGELVSLGVLYVCAPVAN